MLRFRFLLFFAAGVGLRFPLAETSQVEKQLCQTRMGPADPCVHLSHLAREAHAAAQYDREISLRKQLSGQAWAAYKVSKASDSGQFRYWIINMNDIPLGLLLAGNHRMVEAEAVFRNNRIELERERLAGKDIKSENDLLLAHVLTKEGKQSEGGSICRYWKDRVKHNADGLLWATPHNIPAPPVYDTREVEDAAWDLDCGRPEEGFTLLTQQIALHPHMSASFTALSNYYFVEGDFEAARKADADGARSVKGD